MPSVPGNTRLFEQSAQTCVSVQTILRKQGAEFRNTTYKLRVRFQNCAVSRSIAPRRTLRQAGNTVRIGGNLLRAIMCCDMRAPYLDALVRQFSGQSPICRNAARLTLRQSQARTCRYLYTPNIHQAAPPAGFRSCAADRCRVQLIRPTRCGASSCRTVTLVLSKRSGTTVPADTCACRSTRARHTRP